MDPGTGSDLEARSEDEEQQPKVHKGAVAAEGATEPTHINGAMDSENREAAMRVSEVVV